MPFRKLVLLFAAVSVLGCGEEDLPTGVLPTGPTGRFRVVNAVSDPTRANRVNITVDGTPVRVDVAYGQAGPATLYYPALAGDRQLRMVQTSSQAVLVDEAITIEADQDVTVIAVGATGPIETVIITDDNTAPAAGSVKIRGVNAALSSAGAVDVYVTATAADVATATPVATAVAVNEAGAYATVPAGVHRVTFTSTGTKTVVGAVTLPTLASGAVRTVLLLDAAAGGTPLATATLTDR